MHLFLCFFVNCKGKSLKKCLDLVSSFYFRFYICFIKGTVCEQEHFGKMQKTFHRGNLTFVEMRNYIRKKQC